MVIIKNFPRIFVHEIQKTKVVKKVDIPQTDGQISIFMLKENIRLTPKTDKCQLTFNDKPVLVHKKNGEKLYMSPEDIKKNYYENIADYKKKNAKK